MSDSAGTALDKLEEIEERTAALTTEVSKRPMDGEILARLQHEADELGGKIRELRAQL
jgi:hypothetical protein